MTSIGYGLDYLSARGPMAQQSMTNLGAFGGRSSQVPVRGAGSAVPANPMFGRPTWAYIGTATGPVYGPQPRLARGSGYTAGFAISPGNSTLLPGYMENQEYRPSTFSYDPVNIQQFAIQLPRTIGVGDDGKEVVGTYRAHDFTPADRQLAHMRQAANWQVMEYPPDTRDLLAWQQAMRYRVNSLTLSPRPLGQNDYFLGYQVNPQVASLIGQTTMGYMGSK